MNDEMVAQLQALLQQYDDRIKALETSVNDVLIGGWKKADAEYRDQEAFNKFNEAYGADIEPFKPYFARLWGEDYDLPRGLYDELKNVEGYGTEGFDEKALMAEKLAELKDKFAGWDLSEPVTETEEGSTEEVAETPSAETATAEEKTVEEPSAEPTAEELDAIYKKYNS